MWAAAIYGSGSILVRTARQTRRGNFGLSAAESASATTEVKDGADKWARDGSDMECEAGLSVTMHKGRGGMVWRGLLAGLAR